MKLLKGCGLVMSVLVVSLAAGCTSSDVEAESDRRSRELDDENSGLRRQLEDQGAVERAQARELEGLKNRAQEAESRLAAAENRAREAELERQRLLAQRSERPSGERPASLTSSPKAAVSTEGLNIPGVEVAKTDEGKLALRLAGSVMFDPGKDELTAEGRKVLDRVGAALKRRPELQVSVEGHTDATPLGKTKDVWGTNLALSLARAMAVQDYLHQKQGIPEKRMTVVGHGDRRLLMSGTSKEANDKNRRVELVLSQS